MHLLLDTHILIWAITGDDKLPPEALHLLQDAKNEIFYSTASIWEITIKHAIRPDDMPISGSELSKYAREAGFHSLPIMDDHAKTLETLHRDTNAPKHKDPFDRMLIAQAKSETMTFVTHDSLLKDYHEACVLNV